MALSFPWIGMALAMTRPTIQDECRYRSRLGAQANTRTQKASFRTNRE